MLVTARLKNLRIAPRKVRLVADLIRGKRVVGAQSILKFTVKGASEPILKLLNQAVSNAKNNFQLELDNLYISKITVDEGQTLKRWRARARGQAYEIQKKTSHINLVLDELKKKVKKTKAKIVKKNDIKEEKLEEKKEENIIKTEKPKFNSQADIKKPVVKKGLKRIFRRKSF